MIPKGKRIKAEMVLAILHLIIYLMKKCPSFNFTHSARLLRKIHGMLHFIPIQNNEMKSPPRVQGPSVGVKKQNEIFILLHSEK